MDINALLTDEKLEEEGVWLPYRDNSQVKLASPANRKFERLQRALEKPYRRQIQLGTLDPNIQSEILCRCMARHVLLDWKGFTKAGKPLPYGEQAAFDLLMMSRPFRNDIAAMAADEEAFRREIDEAAEKNSATSSASGSRSTPRS